MLTVPVVGPGIWDGLRCEALLKARLSSTDGHRIISS
jgi:hypothetical protein